MSATLAATPLLANAPTETRKTFDQLLQEAGAEILPEQLFEDHKRMMLVVSYDNRGFGPTVKRFGPAILGLFYVTIVLSVALAVVSLGAMILDLGIASITYYADGKASWMLSSTTMWLASIYFAIVVGVFFLAGWTDSLSGFTDWMENIAGSQWQSTPFAQYKQVASMPTTLRTVVAKVDALPNVKVFVETIDLDPLVCAERYPHFWSRRPEKRYIGCWNAPLLEHRLSLRKR